LIKKSLHDAKPAYLVLAFAGNNLTGARSRAAVSARWARRFVERYRGDARRADPSPRARRVHAVCSWDRPR